MNDSRFSVFESSYDGESLVKINRMFRTHFSIFILAISLASCRTNLYVAETPVIPDQRDAHELSLNGTIYTVNGEMGLSAAGSYSSTKYAVIGAHFCFSETTERKRFAGGISGGFFMPFLKRAQLCVLGNIDAGKVDYPVSHYQREVSRNGDFVRLTVQPQFTLFGRYTRTYFGVRLGHIELNTHNWYGNNAIKTGFVADPYFGFGVGVDAFRLTLNWTWNTQNYYNDDQRINFGIGVSSTLNPKKAFKASRNKRHHN